MWQRSQLIQRIAEIRSGGASTPSPNALVIRPEATSARELQSMSGSTVTFCWLAIIFTALGLPAFAAAWIWQSLGIATILSMTGVTMANVFMLVYIVGFACAIPTAGLMLLLNFYMQRGDKYGPTLVLDEDGLYWQGPLLTTIGLLVLNQMPICKLPWSSIKLIANKFPDKEQCESIGVDRKWLVWNPGMRVLFSDDAGKLRNFRIIYESLNKNQRLVLLQAFLQWAKDSLITPEAITSLGGSSAIKTDNDKFTRIWLELLQNKGMEVKGGALPAGHELLDGTLTVESRIATGGQANIYVARRSEGDMVVIKEFVLAGTDASGRLSSATDFENEYRVLSKTQSQHVIQLIDIFVESNRAYLVLEHAKGDSLRKLIQTQGAFSPHRAAEVLRQTAEAVAALHTQAPPMVHRDISPENIIITDKGDVKLVDFSLAAPAGQVTEQVVGKQCYLSPQQFRGEVETSNDIYSLGAVLYFMLAGEDPEAISTSRFPQEPHLDAIVAKCTALDAAQRYANAAELMKELDDVLNLKLAGVTLS